MTVGVVVGVPVGLTVGVTEGVTEGAVLHQDIWARVVSFGSEVVRLATERVQGGDIKRSLVELFPWRVMFT